MFRQLAALGGELATVAVAKVMDTVTDLLQVAGWVGIPTLLVVLLVTAMALAL